MAKAKPTALERARAAVALARADTIGDRLTPQQRAALERLARPRGGRGTSRGRGPTEGES